MLRKKLSVAVAVFIAAQMIAVACYVSTSRVCPAQIILGTSTFSFINGTGGSNNNGNYDYPWVTTSSPGSSSAQSDGTPHCEYQSSDGTVFWAYPGANPTGSSCGSSGGGGGA